jgi:hypothetical protein
VSAIGLFERIKQRARLVAAQTEEPSRELGDLIEPGSSVEASGMAPGSAGAAANLQQLKELRDSGLIDADTYDLIEASITNPTAVAGIDAADLDLLQRGVAATATVLALPEASDEAGARPTMTLEVHPAVGSPYEAGCTIAAGHPGGELKVGDFLPAGSTPSILGTSRSTGSRSVPERCLEDVGASQPTSRAGPRRPHADSRRGWARR